MSNTREIGAWWLGDVDKKRYCIALHYMLIFYIHDFFLNLGEKKGNNHVMDEMENLFNYMVIRHKIQ